MVATLLKDLPVVPTGKIKTFGAFGPKYEVRELLHRLPDGDWMVGIRMVETGEETQYLYSHMTDDPEAQ